MKKNTSHNVDVTLILPCYNEREHFKRSVEYIIRVLKLCRFSYEIIFIDDFSTDGTQNLIKDITKSSANTLSIFHAVNQGRGASVMEGIRMSKSEIVGFMDIDCEVSPVYLPLFIDEIRHGADLVVGRRYYPKEFKASLLYRDITSAIYSYLRKTLIPLPVEDTETGYKFFRKKKIMPILPKIKNSHWFLGYRNYCTINSSPYHS